MCCDNEVFKDSIVGAPSSIKVNALLQPNSGYIWVITDPFANQYEQAFTTDADGHGFINTTSLPVGFMVGLPRFTIQVKKPGNTCRFEQLIFPVSFDRAVVKIASGTGSKTFVGCDLDVLVSSDVVLQLATKAVTADTTTVTIAALIGKSIAFILYAGQEVGDFTFDSTVGTFTFPAALAAGYTLKVIYYDSVTTSPALKIINRAVNAVTTTLTPVDANNEAVLLGRSIGFILYAGQEIADYSFDTNTGELDFTAMGGLQPGYTLKIIYQ